MTTAEPTVTEPKTLPARRARRTRAAVTTVLPSVHGIAACTGHQELFDQAENYRPPLDVRLRASAICDPCPLAATCGFRITPPAQRTRPRT